MKINYNKTTQEMQFKTTSCILPSTPGLHVIPAPCGSGKTTLIASVAASKVDTGVLIIEQTIEAADEIEAKIRTELGLRALEPGIELNLNCQNKEIMGEYKKDPEMLSGVKILIVTSVRTMIDPMLLFLSFGSGQRGLVMIDEMIGFYPEPFMIPDDMKDKLTFVDGVRSHHGRKALQNISGAAKELYLHTYSDIDTMRAAVWNGRKPKHRLDQYKADAMFSHVLNHGFSPILQRVQDYCDSVPVILFDGTADCIFGNDPRLVPMTGEKYSSDINFIQYHSSLKRKNNEEWTEETLKVVASEAIKIVSQRTKRGHHVLVVTWKTIEKFRPRNTKNDADSLEGPDKTSYSFPGLLERVLIDSGADPDKFKVIYRGSGQDRGNNSFRDFDTVLFLGEWRIPDDITRDINNQFGCRCEFRDYMKSLIIQTICRLRIRNHMGEPVSVYFSSDIDYNMMWSVQEYFKANSNPECKIQGLRKPCEKTGKPEKGWLCDLVSLYSYDGKIRDSVVNGYDYSFSISLKELYKYVPMDKKSKDRYKNLQKYLKTRGIDMTII